MDTSKILPPIRYSFVPDTEHKITAQELAEVMSLLFNGLSITVSEDFLHSTVPEPLRRHFAFTQQHVSDGIQHEPDSKPV